MNKHVKWMLYVTFMFCGVTVVTLLQFRVKSTRSAYYTHALIRRFTNDTIPMADRSNVDIFSAIRYGISHVLSFFGGSSLLDRLQVNADKLNVKRSGRHSFQNVTSLGDLIAYSAYIDRPAVESSETNIRVLLLYKNECFEADCPVMADVICIFWYGGGQTISQANNADFQIVPDHHYKR